MSYEDRQHARQAHYLFKAEALERQAELHFKVSHDATAGIPLGQPILVGHHSERRHRADLAKSHRHITQGIEAEKLAEHYRRKATAVGSGGISSDDEQAVEKLKAKLIALQARQARMKTANQMIRQQGHAITVAELLAIGLEEHQAASILTPDERGKRGFPAYALRNNYAEIRRVQQRITHRETAAAKPPAAPVAGHGYTLSEADNRLQFIFDAKPAEALRTVLKRNGFKWSPSRGAWVRKLTGGARCAAQQVRSALDQDAAQPNAE